MIAHSASLKKVSQFLFLSSIKLYKKNKELNEGSLIETNSNYTKLKLLCENKIQQLSNSTEMCFKIIRVSNVFGIPKNYKMNFDKLLIPNMIIQSLKTKKIILKNPNMYKDFISIEDFLDKFLLILNYNKKLLRVNTFNLGSYKSLSLNYVASIIKKIQKKHKILIKKNICDDTNKIFKFYSKFSFLKETYNNDKFKINIKELVLFYEKKIIDNFISIVIPTFNQAEFLDRALSSLVSQTYKKFEVIIIDNKSSDNTVSIYQKYKNILNINFISIINKGIIAKSRNIGINKSHGEIISFLDSDDYWKKNKLSIVNKTFKENSIDIFCHNELSLDEYGNHLNKLKYGFKSRLTYNNLLVYGNCLSTSAVSISKSFIINNKLKFSEKVKFITAEDYDFWLKLAKRNARFYFCSMYLGFYQLHTKSNSTKDILNHQNNVNNVINYHIKKIKSKNIKELSRARMKLSYMKLMIKNKKLREIYVISKNFKFGDIYYFIKFIFFKLSKKY